MIHMDGESWCTTKDLKVPFSFLKAGHVDHLLSYTKRLYIILLVCSYRKDNKIYFSKPMRLTNLLTKLIFINFVISCIF